LSVAAASCSVTVRDKEKDSVPGADTVTSGTAGVTLCGNDMAHKETSVSGGGVVVIARTADAAGPGRPVTSALMVCSCNPSTVSSVNHPAAIASCFVIVRGDDTTSGGENSVSGAGNTERLLCGTGNEETSVPGTAAVSTGTSCISGDDVAGNEEAPEAGGGAVTAGSGTSDSACPDAITSATKC